MLYDKDDGIISHVFGNCIRYGSVVAHGKEIVLLGLEN